LVRPRLQEEYKCPDVSTLRSSKKEEVSVDQKKIEEEKKEEMKPKKLWRAPQSTAFSQLMKGEMTGNDNQAPKFLEKGAYNEMKQTVPKNPLKQQEEEPSVFGAPVGTEGGGG